MAYAYACKHHGTHRGPRCCAHAVPIKDDAAFRSRIMRNIPAPCALDLPVTARELAHVFFDYIHGRGEFFNRREDLEDRVAELLSDSRERPPRDYTAIPVAQSTQDTGGDDEHRDEAGARARVGGGDVGSGRSPAAPDRPDAGLPSAPSVPQCAADDLGAGAVGGSSDADAAERRAAVTDAVVARYMGYLKDEADTLEGLMRHGHAPQHLATAIAASVQRLRGHTAVLEELRKR